MDSAKDLTRIESSHQFFAVEDLCPLDKVWDGDNCLHTLLHQERQLYDVS